MLQRGRVAASEFPRYSPPAQPPPTSPKAAAAIDPRRSDPLRAQIAVLKGAAARIANEAEHVRGQDVRWYDLARDYDSLVRKAKSVLLNDPYASALEEIGVHGSPLGMAKWAGTLAKELEMYLTTSDAKAALKEAAAALAKRARSVRDWADEYFLAFEYNLLVRKVKLLFGDEPYFQSLDEIRGSRSKDSIARLADEVDNMLGRR